MIRCVHCKELMSGPRDTDAVLSSLSRMQVRTLDPEPDDRRRLLAVCAMSAALELAGWCSTCVLAHQVEVFGVALRAEPDAPARPRGGFRLQLVRP